MRTTITLDDSLIAEAIECSGIEEKSKLISFALRELVNRERAAKFLALEGTMPDLEFARRDYRSGRSPEAAPMLNESHE